MNTIEEGMGEITVGEYSSSPPVERGDNTHRVVFRIGKGKDVVLCYLKSGGKWSLELEASENASVVEFSDGKRYFEIRLEPIKNGK